MFSSGKNLSSDESQRSDGEDVDEVDQDAVEDTKKKEMGLPPCGSPQS